jgi:hypothetical protein
VQQAHQADLPAAHPNAIPTQKGIPSAAFVTLWGIKNNKMKIATIGLLTILISMTCLASTEDKADSLIQVISSQNRAEIVKTDLLGRWSREEGFLTKDLTLKNDDKFSSSNLTCFGKQTTKGRWTLQEPGEVRLQAAKRTTQVDVAKLNGQIYLWTEDEIKQVRAVTDDYLKIGEL